jgi:hypothetical protein
MPVCANLRHVSRPKPRFDPVTNAMPVMIVALAEQPTAKLVAGNDGADRGEAEVAQPFVVW